MKNDGHYITISVDDDQRAQYEVNSWVHFGYSDACKNVFLQTFNYGGSKENSTVSMGDMALFSIKLSGKALVRSTPHSSIFADGHRG